VICGFLPNEKYGTVSLVKRAIQMAKIAAVLVLREQQNRNILPQGPKPL